MRRSAMRENDLDTFILGNGYGWDEIAVSRKDYGFGDCRSIAKTNQFHGKQDINLLLLENWPAI